MNKQAVVSVETARRSARKRAVCLPLAALSLLPLTAVGARADDLVYATGRVLDANGRPLANALVAVYDDANKVVDYGRTDQNGAYGVAVPRRTLHLDKRGKSFFTEVVGGLTRFIGDAAGFAANPVRAGVKAVTSSEASNFADPLTKGGITVGGAVADRVLSMATPRSRRATLQEERKQPGAMLIKVVTPGASDLVGVQRVYWLQQETFRAGGKTNKTLAAWLDPVRLTPTESETPSSVDSTYLRFTSARLEPSLAEPGQRVRVMAKLPLPPDPPVYLIVVARNNRTGQKWELTPTGGGRYEGEFVVDKRFPANDQAISILAYAAQQRTPGRRPDAEHAIEGAGLWDANKPFTYDPLLVVSRNRADLILTVVIPEKRHKS